MRIIAGRDRGDGGIKILDRNAFEILRLKTLPGPAAGAGATIAKGAADAVVVAGAGQQRVELLGGRLSAVKSKRQRLTHWHSEPVGVLEQLLDYLAVE